MTKRQRNKPNATAEVRERIIEAITGYDIGLTIAAMGHVVQMLFNHIDNTAPHLSLKAREDFKMHSTRKTDA